MTQPANLLLPKSLFVSPDRLTKASERWAMLQAKLETARDVGVTFRTDIASFEQSHGYGAHTPSYQNNCYASAVGFLVTGDRTLHPGMIAPLFQDNRDGILYGDAKNNIVPPYIAQNPDLFNQTFRQGLLADGILDNIPIDQAGHYVPLIGLTYYQKYKSDFHFIVPLKDGAFSDRQHRQGSIEYFANAQDMSNTYLGRDCLQADVYFAPKLYHGQKAVITDASRARVNNIYHGASAAMFGG